MGIQQAIANVNGKIWALIDEAMEYMIVRYEDQMPTLRLYNQGKGMEMVISLVYDKCALNVNCSYGNPKKQ